MFELRALFLTSDGNASLRVYEYDNCFCLEKSVILGLHSQVFFVVSCFKRFVVCHGKEHSHSKQYLMGKYLVNSFLLLNVMDFPSVFVESMFAHFKTTPIYTY